MGINAIGVGYEGLDAEGLLSRLRIHGVKTVIDVRLNPISRKRGMSKNGLIERLAASNIDYMHLPALGNPKDNREGFADILGDRGQDARRRFRDLIDQPAGAAALDRIIEVASGGRVAVLCFEEDEAACHRSIVLAAVQDRALARV